jgi:predicted DNA-binding transcriptional regulator AlpA
MMGAGMSKKPERLDHVTPKGVTTPTCLQKHSANMGGSDPSETARNKTGLERRNSKAIRAEDDDVADGTSESTSVNSKRASLGDEDVLLTTDQLARFLGVSKSFVVKKREDGSGPEYTRMGDRVIRYPLSAARQWRDARQVRQRAPRRNGK